MTGAETARADSFGSGENAFSIDFVNVGNAGNADDSGAGGGIYSSPSGGVGYDYRVSTYEISQDAITKATNLGMTNVTAGAHAGNRPAANISWFEAAAFVNWLNTSQGLQAAYNLTFSGTWSLTVWGESDRATTGVDSGTNPYRHKNAFYVLPSEDEWYKAAFHQNTGVNANYWDYATGSNSTPTAVASGTTAGTVVFDGQPNPADVDSAGGLSSYGTMGQTGNVFEWIESASPPTDGSRLFLGGKWTSASDELRSSFTNYIEPEAQESDVGFRVVSVVPEPHEYAIMVTGMLGLLIVLRRMRRKAKTA